MGLSVGYTNKYTKHELQSEGQAYLTDRVLGTFVPIILCIYGKHISVIYYSQFEVDIALLPRSIGLLWIIISFFPH